MENCAHAGQQFHTTGVNVGPPGSVEFTVYAQNQSTRHTCRLVHGAERTDEKDRERLHGRTRSRKNAKSSSLVYAIQTYMHPLKFILMSLRLEIYFPRQNIFKKKSYFTLHHTGSEVSEKKIKQGRDGPRSV